MLALVQITRALGGEESIDTMWTWVIGESSIVEMKLGGGVDKEHSTPRGGDAAPEAQGRQSAGSKLVRMAAAEGEMASQIG